MDIRQEFRDFLREKEAKELNEASKKIKNMTSNEIQGEVEYFLLNAGEKFNSSDLSENIEKYMAYLKSEFGDKKINKVLSIKINKGTL